MNRDAPHEFRETPFVLKTLPKAGPLDDSQGVVDYQHQDNRDHDPYHFSLVAALIAAYPFGAAPRSAL